MNVEIFVYNKNKNENEHENNACSNIIKEFKRTFNDASFLPGTSVINGNIYNNCTISFKNINITPINIQHKWNIIKYANPNTLSNDPAFEYGYLKIDGYYQGYIHNYLNNNYPLRRYD